MKSIPKDNRILQNPIENDILKNQIAKYLETEAKQLRKKIAVK